MFVCDFSELCLRFWSNLNKSETNPLQSSGFNICAKLLGKIVSDRCQSNFVFLQKINRVASCDQVLNVP